eukprot:jgi/Mesen1/2793/ME000170S01890
MASKAAFFVAFLALFSCAASAADIDVAILNFALNLECLEAQFYSYAAYGKGLSSADTGNGPKVVGGKKALLSPAAQSIAADIADDEISHVRLLRGALGKAAVKCPLIDIGNAFGAAADAAIGAKLSPAFSPYGSDIVFYHGAFIFEDVGVTAYKGAAKLITNKDYLEVAAGILAVEAYHGGFIRAKLLDSANVYVFPYKTQVKNIIAAISALRATVSGAKDDQGIVVDGKYVIAPADTTAVAFSRNTTQVLNIVYLGNKAKGGFFPNGLNGAITK